MFIPELGMIEPRPCHEHFPMKPRSWQLTDVTAWGADFSFDLVGVDKTQWRVRTGRWEQARPTSSSLSYARSVMGQTEKNSE
jgi:hypothetical protein